MSSTQQDTMNETTVKTIEFLDLPNMGYSKKVRIKKPLRHYLELLTLQQRNALVSTIYAAMKLYREQDPDWTKPIRFAKNRAKLVSTERKVYEVVECIYKTEDLAKVCICANSFMHYEDQE